MNLRRWTILGWLLLLVGLAPLFWFRAFWLDWFNFVWLTNYYSHISATTGDFPSMLCAAFANAPQYPHVETGFPNLYGVLFFPLAGALAKLLGGDLVIRLLVIASILAAFEAWRRLTWRLTGHALVSVIAALGVAAHAYVFTNLYSRSALPEFFGMQWMAISVAVVVRWLAQARLGSPARGWTIFAAFLGVTLVGGTHPLSFYLWGLVMLPVLLVSAGLLSWRPTRSQIGWALAGAAVLLAVLGPWMRDALRWSGEILATHEKLSVGSEFDDWRQRFSLVPFDPQIWLAGDTKHLRYTPFLESPLNWLLGVAAAVGLVALARRGGVDRDTRVRWLGLSTLLLVLAVITVASASLSLGTGSAAIERVMRPLLQPAQFGYRLVGPLQVALVLIFVLAVHFLKTDAAGARFPETDNRLPRRLRVAIGAVFGVAVLGIGIKVGSLFTFLPQLHREWGFSRPGDYQRWVNDTATLPPQFYGLSSYQVLGPSAPATAPAPAQKNVYIQHDPKHPWSTYEIPLDVPAGTTVWISALVNPFTRIVLDDQVVPWSELRTWDRCFVLTVPHPGARLRVEVDPVRHQRLNRQPWIWLVAALAVLLLAWREARRSRRPVLAPAPATR